MPEYLSPGVYIEETSFRARSIEGGSTSTAGFVGPARFGRRAGNIRVTFGLRVGGSAFVPAVRSGSTIVVPATLTRLLDGDLVHVRTRTATTTSTPAGAWTNQADALGGSTDGLFAAR